eukprot:c8633_g1_i1.p1 GENE.c8633_g1_i1~~c8633_g1_i1.p1  ORF type:complete len:915 (+),score=211.38 c8633_g1_i1:24-2747(+)
MSFLNHNDSRQATAAVCLVRAIRRLPPTFCAPRRAKWFLLFHSNLYRKALLWVSLFHAIVLTTWEPPPRTYHMSLKQTIDAGYTISGVTIFDCLVLAFYVFHIFLMFFCTGTPQVAEPPLRNSIRFTIVDDSELEREADALLPAEHPPIPHISHIQSSTISRSVAKISSTFTSRQGVDKPLAFLVLLLVIDGFINLSYRNFNGFRPFRFLRPMVYILVDPRQRLMFNAILASFLPLLKVAFIMIAVIMFYAILGLNFFKGNASDSNPFGAACLEQSGRVHSFLNFARSFITLYVLSTAANFPDAIWPFFTCECSFVSLDGGVTPDYTMKKLDWCKTRKALAIAFFGSYMVVIFFCIKSCVLAACFYFYQKISNADILDSLVNQRYSAIASFKCLKKRGERTIDKASVVSIVPALSTLLMRNEKKLLKTIDFLFSGQNQIDVKRLLILPDLLTVRVTLAEHRDRFRLYSLWKQSKVRKWCLALATKRVNLLSYLDLIGLLALCFNAVVLSVNQESGDLRSNTNDVVLVIFVIEMILKIAGLGIQTFRLDGWNIFDGSIVLWCCAGRIWEYQENHQSHVQTYLPPIFRLIQNMRLLRLLKIIAIAGLGEILMKMLLLRIVAAVLKRKAPSLRNLESSYQRLFHVLAITLPICVKVILVLYLYVSSFALLVMEIISTKTLSSLNYASSAGVVDMTGGDKGMFDWGDMIMSTWSAMTIVVQNTWNVVLENAMLSRSFHIAWFFIAFHFVSVLIVMIVTSLFLAAFGNMLDLDGYERTYDKVVKGTTVDAWANATAKLKGIQRTTLLEYLIITTKDVEDTFQRWREVHVQKRGWVAEELRAFIQKRVPEPIKESSFDQLAPGTQQLLVRAQSEEVVAVAAADLQKRKSRRKSKDSKDPKDLKEPKDSKDSKE